MSFVRSLIAAAQQANAEESRSERINASVNAVFEIVRQESEAKRSKAFATREEALDAAKAEIDAKLK